MIKFYALYKKSSHIPNMLNYYLRIPIDRPGGMDLSSMYVKEFDGEEYQLYGFIFRKEIYKEFFRNRKKDLYHVRVLSVEKSLVKKLKSFFQAFMISWVEYKDSFNYEKNEISTIKILSSKMEHDYIRTCWIEMVFLDKNLTYLTKDLVRSLNDKYLQCVSNLTLTTGIDIVDEDGQEIMEKPYERIEFGMDDSLEVSDKIVGSNLTWYIDFTLHPKESNLFVKAFKEELRR